MIRIQVFDLVAEDGKCFIRHIQIGFCDHFVRSVHRKHGNAEVNDVDVLFCDINGNRSAAATVDLTKLARLPYDSRFVEHIAYVAYEFSSSI